jgi:coenzyme F420-0:L-glutamate ligase / coenzyme F420-1:gamma-L-glutamate ligase
MSARELRVRPLAELPEVRKGDDVGAMVSAAASPRSDEVVVLSQKVVSKTEGRIRTLSEVRPGQRAREVAELVGKSPELVELILAESRAVIRAVPGVLLTETHAGWICANAGIDASNLPGQGTVALLPEDADASARRIRAEIRAASGQAPAVIIADSFGRPWRIGQTDIALGCAGIEALDDWRGRTDAEGRRLGATAIAVVDQLAAAADLARDKDSRVPGAVVSGVGHLVADADGPGARVLQRPAGQDLFR